MLSRLAVGGLLLEVVEGWEFRVLNGVVVGQSDHADGVLRIKTHEPNSLPSPLAHSACLAVACGFADVSWVTPYSRRTLETATGPLGSAAYHKRNDMVQVWYCLRPVGLVTGAYSCPWDAHRSRQERQAIADCELMVSTVIFDRLAWGANDALTRVLVEQLKSSESEAKRTDGSRHTPSRHK